MFVIVYKSFHLTKLIYKNNNPILNMSSQIKSFPHPITNIRFLNVSNNIKNVNVPDSVKKKLLFGEALTRDLETSYKEMLKENDTFDLENEGSTVDENVTIGDHVLMKWGTSKYPGEVLSVFEEGLMVRCMKQGVKFWRWPNIKDEQLYKWEDVMQKIKPPKLIKRGNYVITELDVSTSD